MMSYTIFYFPITPPYQGGTNGHVHANQHTNHFQHYGVNMPHNMSLFNNANLTSYVTSSTHNGSRAPSVSPPAKLRCQQTKRKPRVLFSAQQVRRAGGRRRGPAGV